MVDSKLAERLVAEYFKTQGYDSELSEDEYDPDKDVSLRKDGVLIKVEVKLQSLYEHYKPYDGYPFQPYKAFTVPILSDTRISTNQLSKCLSVDKLIFVRRPRTSDEPVVMYEAPPAGFRKFVVSQNKNDKRFIAAFRLDEMTQLGVFDHPSLIEKLKVKGKQYA